MRFTTAFLDELRARISISEIVGAKLAWDRKKSQPARGDYWARCPFHQEKSSSFHVLEAKGIYYCFGCQATGGALDFVMKTENLSFPEAVERLAGHAGMPPPTRDPQAAAAREANAGLAELNESAIRFYRAQLHGAAGREALAYLHRRGLTAQTIDAFELGYAPAAGSALAQHLRQSGGAPADLEKAGLCAARDDGSLYDRMRDRVIFPIRDGRNRAIAFGGRALSAEAKAKYLNSPDTPLFHKGETLFNLARARTAGATAKNGNLVVVEGYMDAISLHQAGLPQVVAPLGTALTEHHIRQLWRMADEPILLLDGDAAGQRAADRAMDLALPLLSAGKSLRFAAPPAGQDPDDLARSGGKAAVQALIDKAEPLIERLWRRETETRPLDTPERRAAFDSRLRELLGLIRESDLRDHYRMAFGERRRALFGGSGRGEPRSDSGGDSRRESYRTNQGSGLSRGAGGGRFGAGSGGRGFWREPPIRATSSTKSARWTTGDMRVTQRLALEARVLFICLLRPEFIERFESELAGWEFASDELDLIRGALLSSAAARIALGETPRRSDLEQDLEKRGAAEAGRQLSARLTAQAMDGALRGEASEAEAEAELEKAFAELASFLPVAAPPPLEDPDFAGRIAREHAAAMAKLGGAEGGADIDRDCADLGAAIANARAVKSAKRR